MQKLTYAPFKATFAGLAALFCVCAATTFAIDPEPDLKTLVFPSMSPKAGHSPSNVVGRESQRIRTFSETIFEDFWKEISYYKYDASTGLKERGFYNDTKTYGYVNLQWPIQNRQKNPKEEGFPTSFLGTPTELQNVGGETNIVGGVTNIVGGVTNLVATGLLFESQQGLGGGERIKEPPTDNIPPFGGELPLVDGFWTPGESFQDRNGNGRHDDGVIEDYWNVDNFAPIQVNSCGELFPKVFHINTVDDPAEDWSATRGEFFADYNGSSDLANGILGYDASVALEVADESGGTNVTIFINELDVTPTILNGMNRCTDLEGDFEHVIVDLGAVGPGADVPRNGVFDYNVDTLGNPLVTPAFRSGTSNEVFIVYKRYTSADSLNIELVSVPVYQSGELFNQNLFMLSDQNIYGDPFLLEPVQDGLWTGTPGELFEDYISWWTPAARNREDKFTYIEGTDVEDRHPLRGQAISVEDYEAYIRWNYPGDVEGLIAQRGNGLYDGPDEWTDQGDSKHKRFISLGGVTTPDPNESNWDGRTFPTWQDWWEATFGGTAPEWKNGIPILEPHIATVGTNGTPDAWIPVSGDWGYDGGREFCDLPSSIYHLGGDPNSATNLFDEEGNFNRLGILGGDGQLGESTDPFGESIHGRDYGSNNPFSPNTTDSPDSLIEPAGPFAYRIHGQSGWDAGNQLNIEMLTWLTDPPAAVDLMDRTQVTGFHPVEFRDINLDGMIDSGSVPKLEANYAISINSGALPGTGSYPYNRQRYVEDLIEAWDFSEDFVLSFLSPVTGANLPLYAASVYLPNPTNIPPAGDGFSAEFGYAELAGISGGFVTILTLDSDESIDFGLQVLAQSSTNEFNMSTVAHEQGHDLFGWPDLYDYDSKNGGPQVINEPIGAYDLMSRNSFIHGIPTLKENVGNRIGPGTAPEPDGWIDVQEITNLVAIADGPVTLEFFPIENNVDQYYLFENPERPFEYFYLWYASGNTDLETPAGGPGVYISHCDLGAYENALPSQQRLNNHFLFELLQADGLNELQDGVNVGDAGDSFPGSSNQRVFSADTQPAARWWDQSDAGLRILDIELPDPASGQPALVTIERYDPGAPWVPPTVGFDRDNDGIIDAWEYHFFRDLTTANATSDFDFDGTSDLNEFILSLDPRDPNDNATGSDRDNDGLSDLDEIDIFGSDPEHPDTDDDGYLDGVEADNLQPAAPDDYGVVTELSGPVYSLSPRIQRSLVARGKSLEAPFSRRFAFFSEANVVAGPSVEILDPATNIESPVRFIELSAIVSLDVPVSLVQVLINGSVVAIPTLDSGGAFTETVIISAGVNNIEVLAIDENGEQGRAAVVVTGTFALADIRATHTWSSAGDLDTWLVDPQGRHTGWTTFGPGFPENVADSIPGSVLDIDDIIGTGPENVTLERGNAVDGEYEVWVNNFSNSGSPVSTVRVLVNEGLPSQQFVEFTTDPLTVSDGNGSNPEAWRLITTVNMPQGTMTPPGAPVGGSGINSNVVGGNIALKGWTIESWVRPPDAAQTGAIASHIVSDTNPSYVVGLRNNRPFIRVRTSSGVWREAVANALPADQWSHLAFVYGQTENSIRIHVDGFLAASQQLLESRWEERGQMIVDTGYSEPGSGVTNFLSGTLVDELRFWERDRRGGVIADNRFTTVSSSPVLVANYRFDDGGLGIEDATQSLDRDYDLGSPVDLLTDAKPGPDGVFGTGDDIPAGVGADGHNDCVTAVDSAYLTGEVDTDMDGMPDWWELLFFDGIAFPGADVDSDGLSNLTEFQVLTNPNSPDSNGNGLFDGSEDADDDGLNNLSEQTAGSHPRLKDTDDDGLFDGSDISPTHALAPSVSRVLAVDGSTSSYVEMPKSRRFALNDWFIEAWIRPDTMGGSVIERQVQAGVYTYFLRVNASGQLVAGFTPTSLTGDVTVESAVTSMQIGCWYQVAASFDAAEGILRVMIDGEEAARLTTTRRPYRNGLGPVAARVGQGFSGLMDEVKVSSQSEVLAYYKFNDGTSATNAAGVWRGTSAKSSWEWGHIQDSSGLFNDDWTEAWRNSGTLVGNAEIVAAPSDAPAQEGEADTNGDGLPDSWYVLQGLDPAGSSVAKQDWDSDGLSNLTEYWLGYDPDNFASFPDGVSDGVRDFDGDGLNNLFEQNESFSRPDLPDTDDDGVEDGDEVLGEPKSSPIRSLDPPKRQSLRLNGSDMVTVERQDRHALRSWTLQAWVRPDASSDGGMVVRRLVNNPLYGSSGVNYELGLATNSTGRLAPYVRYIGFETSGAPMEVMVNGDTSEEVVGGQLAPALVRYEEWTHVAATYDPEVSTLSLYVDGVLAAYRTDAFMPWGLGFDGVRKYKGEVTVGSGFEGYLDEVVILGGASDADNIQNSASRADTLTASLRGVPTASSYAPIMKSISEALEHEYQENEILVRFKSVLTQSEVDTRGTDLGLAYTKSFSMVPVHVMQVADGSSMSNKLEEVRANSSVLYAEPNYRLSKVRIPNDPRYASQWALNNEGQTGGTEGADIRAQGAWDRTTGSRSPLVAIIDTGIDFNHEDLAANIWEDIGYDFFSNDSDPMDNDGHGTHVAGTVAAVGNNAVGISGVAWQSRLMALQFLNDVGTGFTADAIEAIEYAVANGAKISNNSWGGYGYSQALYDAINAAGNAGHLFVAAAGNAGLSNDVFPFYPASFNLPNIISVAAMDDDGAIGSFSNYGQETVHLAAPGVNILSTLPGNSYGSFNGTSMAAPHVAGVASLILSQNPAASYAAIRRTILQSASVTSNFTGLVMTDGILNASAAVGGAGVPVLLFLFDDGGRTVEDFSVAQDWANDWEHAGTLVNGAAMTAAEFYESRIDTNRDGIPDWWYETYGFDPFGASIAQDDEDGDSLNNLYEYLAGTHPRMRDSDRDGTNDDLEDPDGDGLTNYQEQLEGTHPGQADTDDDGFNDRDEINGSSNPLDAYSPENFRAKAFDGTGRMVVRTERDIDDHLNWTVEAWVKPADTSVTGIILRRAERVPYADEDALRWIDYELGLDNNVPYIQYIHRDGQAPVQVRVDAVQAIEAEWTHVAGVMDDADHQLRLYVNGKRVAFQRPVFRPPVSAFGVFETTIGGGHDSGAGVVQAFRGSIDNVRIWDYARTGREVQNNRDVLQPEFSEAGVPDADRAPIRLFNFDDGGLYSQNDRYTGDWLIDWIHGAEAQGGVSDESAPFPPKTLDSDDDTFSDFDEVTANTSVYRSESPFEFKSLSFDGSGEVVVDELVDNEENGLYALPNWTLEAWVQPTALPAGMAPVLRRELKDTGKVSFELGLVNNGGSLVPYARFQRNDSGSEFATLEGVQPVDYGSASNWTHLAATYTNGVFSLYMDGELSIRNTFPGAVPAALGAGRLFLGSTNYQGSLHEVRIWDYVRTRNQIMENYRDLLLFSSSESGVSFDGSTSYLGRFSPPEEAAMPYDYLSQGNLEGIPYTFGRRTHAFTLSSWVKLESFSAGGMVAERLVELVASSDGVDQRVSHGLYITEDGYPEARWWGDLTVATPVRNPTNNVLERINLGLILQQKNFASEIDIRDGEWHHVAVAGDSQNIRLYVDGVLDKESPYNTFFARGGESFETTFSTYAPSGDSLLRIGGKQTQPAEWFDGLIDEVTSWNESLTLQELDRLMRNGLSEGDIIEGLAPINPIPAFAVQTQPEHQRLASYVTFDGRPTLPFVSDRANVDAPYRQLPQADAFRFISPSTPPIEVDRVRNLFGELIGYFPCTDGGAHVENYMYRNNYGYAGCFTGGVDFGPFDPSNAGRDDEDSDNDGLPDAWELEYGFDPYDPTGTNGPSGDPDEDGLSNLSEYQAGTDPSLADTDGDGTPDVDEDSDGDGLNNQAEQNLHGTNPGLPDSDDDFFTDNIEVNQATDPLDSLDPFSFKALDFGCNPAAALDGQVVVDDFVSLTNWTVELLVKLDVASTGEVALLSRRLDIDGERTFELGLMDQVPFIRFEQGPGPGSAQVMDVAPVPVGEWVHLAGCYDNKKLTLLVDGTEIDRVLTTAQPAQGTADLVIGSPGLDGLVREVRVWNDCRPSTVISNTICTTLFTAEGADAASLQLNGDGFLISISSTDSLLNPGKKIDELEGNWTIEAWIRTTDSDGVIAMRSNGQSQPSQFLSDFNYALQIRNGRLLGSFGVGYFEDNGEFSVNFTANDLVGVTPINDGLWHHVAYTVNDDDATLYLDGLLEARQGGFILPSGSVRRPAVQIESGPYIVGLGFQDAEIDEVRLWNVSRSPAEINRTRNQNLDRNEPNLISYFNFDGQVGSLADELAAVRDSATEYGRFIPDAKREPGVNAPIELFPLRTFGGRLLSGYFPGDDGGLSIQDFATVFDSDRAGTFFGNVCFDLLSDSELPCEGEVYRGGNIAFDCPFDGALDPLNAAWTTGATISGAPAYWSCQTNLTSSGETALQSGGVVDAYPVVVDGETSWVQSIVLGPGSICFDWKVSTEAPAFDGNEADYLRFLIDGGLRERITGETGWTNQCFTVGAGNHIVRWEYKKDSFGYLGQDAAWIDNVVFRHTGPDTDGDGLADAYETLVYGTEVLNPDTDGDGVSDGMEILLGTDPLVPDLPILFSMSVNPSGNICLEWSVDQGSRYQVQKTFDLSGNFWINAPSGFSLEEQSLQIAPVAGTLVYCDPSSPDPSGPFYRVIKLP